MSESQAILVSIVIVNWNTREVLRGCLQSVYENLRSDGPSAEVLVVDNGSTDGSVEMVKEAFPRVRLIANRENHGFARANNQAFAVAQGKYLLMLNSDTIVLGDVIARSIEWMDGHPGTGVMGCRVLNEDRTVQRTCLRYPSLLNMALLTTGLWRLKWPRFFGREHMTDWKRDSEREVDVVSGCYLLLRRKVMEQVGMLDESFFFCGEETDWCWRIRKAGWGLRFAPVGEIVHLGNVSGRKRGHRRDLMLTEGLIRFLRKHDGIVVASLAYAILWMFSFGRLMAWSVVALMTRKASAKDRRNFFAAVIWDFGYGWPRVSGQTATAKPAAGVPPRQVSES